jgi:hypothetical protein
VNTVGGEITHPIVAGALRRRTVPVDEALAS